MSTTESNQGESYQGPGRYRHFKGGEYWVYGLTQHTETQEMLVLYQPDYDVPGRTPPRPLCARPLTMWNEAVSRDGYHGPRFMKMADAAAPDLAQRLARALGLN
jgi:hypothetical protein